MDVLIFLWIYFAYACQKKEELFFAVATLLKNEIRVNFK